MAAVWRLIGRGIVHRRGLSIAIFLVGLITMTAAAIGPFYFRAASESILRDRLSGAVAQDVGITVSTETGATGRPPDNMVTQTQQATPPIGYRSHVGMLSILRSGQSSG